MPELPEVETIARGLNRKLRGRRITGFWTDWPKYFQLPKGEALFRKHLVAKKILAVSRRAKNVLIHLSNNHLLLIHQKMSGHLMVGRWQRVNKKSPTNTKKLEKWSSQKWQPDAPVVSPLWDPMNRFIRLIFFLDNKKMLALSDLRRFAKVLCGPEEKILDLPDLKSLGPEPLAPEFTFLKFQNLFRLKRGRIKQVLMDPRFIAGIGNIYADEILWLAKIHPLQKTETLNGLELKTIYAALKKILRKALRLRGTSIDDYRDAAGRKGRYGLVRIAYQREGEPCPRCGTEIKRQKIGGRSAHFCPKCQKLV